MSDPLTLSLSAAQIEMLRVRAAQVGKSAEELATDQLAAWLQASDAFEIAADRVLEHNRELYRRLA